MARNLEWNDLKIGLIGLTVVIAGALSVLLFARVGALHGDTANIYVVTQEAPGVLNGTEVWLSGEKIGLVKDVHFRPVTTDTLKRLAIHLEILADRMHYLRKDAYADIRPGGNLIGSPVVWISSGTSKARALHNGDTLVEISTGKMRPVGDRVVALGKKLTALADSGGTVLGLLQSQAGTAGKMIGQGWPRVTAQTDRLARLARKANSGEGSMPLILHGELGANLASLRARKDSIAYLMTKGNGNIGRLRSDSAFTKQIAHLQSELDSLKQMYGAGGGLSRMKTDTALTAEMARLRVELAALMADAKKHPFRYLKP